mmetsp:Transcript_8537/g.11795  ORF Transcript_8537/g.11795 Transcript_8537/m.11795 type:complete len:1108 (-) Transcript_8537:45-3368(-)
MFNKLKSKNNENRIKVQFNITIQQVKDCPATAFGNDVFVECKRGSKTENHKLTRKVQAKEATVNFDEKIPILCTFNQNAKNKKFEPKKDLTFVLKETRKDSKEKDPKKAGEEIAKGSIDLSTYADTNTVKQETISLVPKDKKGKKVSLSLTIETQWLKVGNKLVVKKGTGNNPEDFVLETADEFTETNASYSDNEEEKFPDDDEEHNNNNKKKLEKTDSKASSVKKGSESGAVDKDQYETEIADLRKDRDRLERKVQRLQEKLDEMEANGPHNPEDANQELEDLRKDKARLEKKVDRLTKETDQLREELEKGGGSGATGNDEVDDLKKDNQRLEKKVEKLTKELNDARSQIPVSGGADDKDQLQKQITDLQNQLKAETESKKELQANLDKLTKSQKEAQTKADENEKKLKDLQKQLSDKTSAVETLEKQLKQEKDKSASKTPAVTTSKDDSSKLKEENAQLSAELKKQQEQFNQKENEYKTKLAKKKEKKVALKAQIQQLQTQASSSSSNQTQIDQLKKENQHLEDEVDELKAESSKKSQTIQSLEDQLQKLRELNTSSSSSSSKQKAVVEQQQQQIQQQSQTIKDLQDELQKIKKDAKQADSAKSESESKISQLQAEIEKLKDDLDDAKSDVQKSNTKRDQYKKELDKLKDEYDEETERMTAEIAKLKEQSNSKQPQASTSASSNNSVSEEKIKKLKDDLAEAQNKIKETETKLKKQLEEKDKEISQLKQLAASEAKKPEKSDSSEDSKKLKRVEKELEAYKRKVAALTRQNQELQLLEEVIYSNDNQFDADKAMPIAVQTLAERLTEWGTLVEADASTQLLEEITTAIKKSFARSAYDSEGLAYWLSFTSNTFVLLKKEIPEDAKPEDFDSLSRPTLADNLEDFKPVTKFFHELTVVSFDIFSVLLINIYSQLDHILVPNVLESADKKKHTNEFPNILGDILKLLKKNFLYDQIIKQFLIQIFYFIDCQLFNTLLKRPDLFTCNSGFQIKMALSQVENSVSKVDKQLSGIVSKQFNHIKEAVNLLLMDKTIVGDEETVKQIFSHLNLIQIKHVLDRFKPDELSPEPVPEKVKRAIDDACKRSGSELSLELDPMKIERVNLLSELA